MASYRLRNGRLNRVTLGCNQLEDRVTPAIDVTGVGAGAYADNGNVFVRHVDVPPTGTGLIDPFLRIHRQGSEQGYNTDYRNSGKGGPGTNLLDDITDPNFTNSITVGQVREVMLDGSGNIVSTGGELYREFRLDLGEPGNDSADSGLVNFSRLQFFLSSSRTEHIVGDTWNNTLGGATLVYNLDGGSEGDIDFTLRDLTSGNGALDYAVYVKSSLLGTDTSKYLYLYSAFGTPPPGADGTFEEWSAEEPDDGSGGQRSIVTIEGRKYEDLNGDGDDENGTDPGLSNWGIEVWLDSNGNGIQDDGESHPLVTDSNGFYIYTENVLNSVLSGPGAAYSSSEVQQVGWTQTGGPAEYTGLITLSNFAVDMLDFGNFKNINISGVKYYDANLNGGWDMPGEPAINGWTFGIDFNDDGDFDDAGETQTTALNGTFSFTDLGPGTYTVYELNGLTGTWVATTSTTAGPFIASSGVNVTGLEFGNVKLGAGGGLTLGFWSNRNGKAAMDAGPGGMAGALALLSGLNLRNADGSHFNPTSYTQFRTWLLNATAINMSYMLSAQLAAMELNVHTGNVNGTSLIYAPGTSSANGAGFATVADVMDEANTALGANGLVLADSPDRSYQEALKNALDKANNNLNFLVGLSAWHDDVIANGVIDEGEI
jgi:hypothetical protein